MHPRNAALLLLATAIGGRVLLHWRNTPTVAPGAVAFQVGARTDLARQRRAAVERTAEVGEGETIDVDRAGAGELARLPGVGPSLARRIVAEREAHGTFGGPACLDARVAGIGAGFLRRAGGHLVYSGGPCRVGSGGKGGRGGMDGTTDSGSTAASAITAITCPTIVLLNTATRAELECLPGIGEARAESILALRERKGGYGRVEELRGVRGLTERVLKGFQGRVSVVPAP